MDKLDWNDLRYVVAVARGGSASAAARLLDVSHATVLRRLQALEQGIGAPLFHRRQTGYELTPAGQQLADAGELIETTVVGTQRSIDGQATDLSGVLRFTTTDSLALALMPPILKAFRERYPQIRVEMIASNARLDLDRREADVVLRPTVRPPQSWVGSRLGPLEFGLYAARSYLEGRASEDWRTLHWVIPCGPFAQRPVVQWLAAQVPAERQVLAADSFVAMRALVLEGVGAALLPRFMGDDKRLQTVGPAPQDDPGELWLLTHETLRHTPRINVFMQHVAESIRSAPWRATAIAD